MTLSADKALAVGKLLHSDRQWNPDGRALYWHAAGVWVRYDPTTPEECWAMARYVATARAPAALDDMRFHTLMACITQNHPAALIDLVLAVGGEHD